MALVVFILIAALAGAVALSWYALPASWAAILLKCSRSVAGLRSRTRIVDGIRWHYLEGGKGPTLLMIHGFGADADNWLLVARQLGRHFHIIAPDLPGFGTSSRGNGLEFDVQGQARRVARFMKHLGFTPSFIAGSSMGGWIAATLARSHFTRVQGLWLIAPLGVKSSVPSEMLRAIATGSVSPVRLEKAEDFERQVYQPMFVKAPPLPSPMRRFYAARAVRRSPLAVQQFQQVLQSRDSLESTLEGIDVPVLLQWGESDRAVDVSGARVLENTVSNIEVLIQEGVGHLPMIETPEFSSRAFLDFCQRNDTDAAPA